MQLTDGANGDGHSLSVAPKRGRRLDRAPLYNAAVTAVPAGLTDAPDAEWEAFAAREPYFTVFPAPRFLRANLTGAAERAFFEDGEARADAICRTIELRLAPHFAPTAILDYGCGIGRLALPFARRARRRGGTVTAVDRSPAMLVAARQQAAQRGLANIEFSTPAELFAGSRTFDFVNCYLVFQRLRPSDGLLLLRALLGCLASGGIGAFQFPYRIRTSPAVRLSRRMRERVPAVNAFINRLRGKAADQPFTASRTYHLNDVLGVFEEAGCAATHVVFDDHDDLQSAIVLAEAPLARRAATDHLEETGPGPDATVPAGAGRSIEVAELVASRSLEDLNLAAERYFASMTDWEYQLAKPFSNAEESSSLLMNVAVLLQGLRVMPGATVLEFGAGTGWLARCLTQLGCRVILLDVSPTALEMARELYARLPPIGDRPAPEFLHFDGEHLDLPDLSVDRIVSFHAFHHVANPNTVLGELGRVLRPGGIAAFAEPGPHHSTTEQSQFEMRMFGVVENDVDVHALWHMAQAHGFRDLKLMVSHGRPFPVSLREFEDLLAGGPTSTAWTASTREHLRNARDFFLVKEGVERVDSRHASALACEVHASLVGAATEGSSLCFDLKVTNTGTAVWLPQDAPYGGVALGVHVHDAAKTRVTTAVLPDRLTDPAREIPPGETRQLRVCLPPQPAGRYVLEFDCVASRVAWFAQAGSHPETVTIEVITSV